MPFYLLEAGKDKRQGLFLCSFQPKVEHLDRKQVLMRTETWRSYLEETTMVGVCEAKHTRLRIRMSRNMLQLHGLYGGTTAGGRCYLVREERKGKLTTAALVLHADVLLVLAGVLVEFALVAVVLPVAAAHRLLGSALAAEGAHALGCQAV